tara:strand:+ start:930 stop:1082 length:153 start_codon:yes stop_codon:yes gene_type:complete
MKNNNKKIKDKKSNSPISTPPVQKTIFSKNKIEDSKSGVRKGIHVNKIRT